MADFGSEVDVTSSMYGQWATEKTLADLLDTIKDLAGTSEEQKKILQRQVTEIKKTGKASGSGGKLNKQEVSASKALTSGLKDAASASLDSAAGLDKLSGPLKGFGKSLKNSSASFKVGLAAMGGLFGLIGKGIGIYKSNLAVISGLSDKGIMLEDGYLGINETLARTGMSLDRFAEFTDKYTRVVGLNGLKAITSLTREAEASAGGFHEFGLTTADAMEYTAEYLDQQRMMGVFKSALDRDQAAAIVENVKNMTRYSKVLNVSRQDLEAASRTMMSDKDLQAELYATIKDPALRKAAQEALRDSAQQLASLGEEGVKAAEYLTDIAASPNPYGSASYIKLVENGQTELANTLISMSENGKAGIKQTMEQTRASVAMTAAQEQQSTALRYVNGEMRDEAVWRTNLGRKAAEAQLQEEEQKTAFIKKHGEFNEAAFKIHLESVSEEAKAAAALENGINKTKATMDRFVIEGLDAATKALIGENGMNGGMIKVGTTLSAWSDGTNDWLNKLKTSDDPIGMITDTVMSGLTVIIAKVGELIAAAVKYGFDHMYDVSLDLGEKSDMIEDGRQSLMTYDERKEDATPWLAGKLNDNYMPAVNKQDTAQYDRLVARKGEGKDIGSEGVRIIADYLARQEASAIRAERQRKQQLDAMNGGAYGYQN